MTDKHALWPGRCTTIPPATAAAPSVGPSCCPSAPTRKTTIAAISCTAASPRASASARRRLTRGQSQRREGVFLCTSDQYHAQKPVKECFYCHLPLKEDATYCPR